MSMLKHTLLSLFSSIQEEDDSILYSVFGLTEPPVSELNRQKFFEVFNSIANISELQILRKEKYLNPDGVDAYIDAHYKELDPYSQLRHRGRQIRKYDGEATQIQKSRAFSATYKREKTLEVQTAMEEWLKEAWPLYLKTIRD